LGLRTPSVVYTTPPACREMSRLHLLLLLATAVALGSTVGIKQVSAAALDDDYPKARRWDGALVPLIGIGVGNLPQSQMDTVVAHALTTDSGYRLIDTGASNEVVLAEAIEKALDDVTEDDTLSIHVVTKVWYTHLGYERTKLAVRQSLANLKSMASGQYVRVHVLLHWPRCDDNISWMDCEGEEERLPQDVKDAGPPPHLDSENAWKGSWKALEEMYNEDDLRRIESIGVSNFDHIDMEMLLEEFEITPHIIQSHVWSLLYDPYLMGMVRDSKVIFQAYGVMNGIVQRGGVAPNAHRLIEDIGKDLANAKSDGNSGKEQEPFSVARVVLAWLVQQGVSVIPRASSLIHQDDDSPRSLNQVPVLSEQQNKDVETAVRALLQGQDIDGPLQPEDDSAQQHDAPPDSVAASFLNSLSDGPIRVFWRNHEGEEEPAHDDPIDSGDTLSLNTHPGHVFVAYSHDGSKRKEFVVEADYGEHQHFDFDEL